MKIIHQFYNFSMLSFNLYDTWLFFNPINWVAVIAVTLTLLHAQRTDALHEMHKILHQPVMRHYWRLDLFSAAKEAVWIFAFLLMKNYSAIIGRLLFCLYPFWRKFYRTHIVPLHVDNIGDLFRM